MQIQPNAVVRTRVTVAVVFFIIINLLISSVSQASEIESPRVANDNFIRLAGALSDHVIANIAVVRAKIGANWELNMNSLDCLSKNVRDQEAGVCLINAENKTNSETYAMYAVLVGEADENGGMKIRSVEFLKQSN